MEAYEILGLLICCMLASSVGATEFFMPIQFKPDTDRNDLVNIKRIYYCLGDEETPRKCAIFRQNLSIWLPGVTLQLAWEGETPSVNQTLTVAVVTQYPRNAWKVAGHHDIHAGQWNGRCKIVLDYKWYARNLNKLSTELVCY